MTTAKIAQLNQVDALERVLELKKQLETPAVLPTKPKRSYLYKDVVAIANQYLPDKRWTYTELLRVFPANLILQVES